MLLFSFYFFLVQLQEKGLQFPCKEKRIWAKFSKIKYSVHVLFVSIMATGFVWMCSLSLYNHSSSSLELLWLPIFWLILKGIYPTGLFSIQVVWFMIFGLATICSYNSTGKGNLQMVLMLETVVASLQAHDCNWALGEWLLLMTVAVSCSRVILLQTYQLAFNKESLWRNQQVVTGCNHMMSYLTTIAKRL